MVSDERATLVTRIRQSIETANYLMEAAQKARFCGFRHPPMLFHWREDWDDMPLSDLLDVGVWLNGIVGRLEKYPRSQACDMEFVDL